MEARLARKGSELDLILERSRQCSWEWNVADNTLSLPRSWYELFGYSQSDVTGGLNSISAFAHPDEAESAQEALIKALKGQVDLYDIQQRMRHKDGHYLHCLVRARVAERDESENTVGVLAISHDVTEKRRHEKQLEKFAECITGRGNGRLLDALARGAVELTGISVAAIAKLNGDGRTATERGELQLHFQPQYNVSGEIFAAETLLRWNHPSRGYVSPADFIPIAEESGLILEIGRWVFEQALECLRCWEHDDMMFLHHLAVNVSSRQFRSPDFVREITRGLVSAGVPPDLLVIEVTEGTVIENFEETARKMEELREIGIRFSVDDFGVGYSSLSYLSRLPLDQLKIDRSFVTNVLQDPNDTVIAETIIGMVRNLHLQTIAEGVETETQLNFLREHGCDGFQGFLFSKPVPESEFLALDRRWILRSE